MYISTDSTISEESTIEIIGIYEYIYENPITPISQDDGNELWGIGVRYNEREYSGQINGDRERR